MRQFERFSYSRAKVRFDQQSGENYHVDHLVEKRIQSADTSNWKKQTFSSGLHIIVFRGDLQLVEEELS